MAIGGPPLPPRRAPGLAANTTGPWSSAARGKTHVDVEELPMKDHLLIYCEGPFEGGRFRGAKLLSESPRPRPGPVSAPRALSAWQQPSSAQGSGTSEGAALEGPRQAQARTLAAARPGACAGSALRPDRPLWTHTPNAASWGLGPGPGQRGGGRRCGRRNSWGRDPHGGQRPVFSGQRAAQFLWEGSPSRSGA